MSPDQHDSTSPLQICFPFPPRLRLSEVLCVLLRVAADAATQRKLLSVRRMLDLQWALGYPRTLR